MRVGSRPTQRRDGARHQRHDRDGDGGRGEACRVGRRQAEQQRRQQSGGGDRHPQAGGHSDGDEHQSLAHHEADDVGSAGAEGDPDADFTRSLADRIGDDGIDTVMASASAARANAAISDRLNRRGATASDR